MSYMVAAHWFTAGLSQVVTAPPSCPTCRLGYCRSMMYWPSIHFSPTTLASFHLTRSGRYGIHYGLATDRESPVFGRRCQMVQRDSSIVLPVISWMQKNMGSRFGTEYIRSLCFRCARHTEPHSLLCPLNSHGCLSFFCRSYQFTARRLIPRR